MDKKIRTLYFEFEIALSALLMVADDFLPGGDSRFDAAVAKVKAAKLAIWSAENNADSTMRDNLPVTQQQRAIS